MEVLRFRFSTPSESFVVEKVTEYFHLPIPQFIDIFLPKKYQWLHVSSDQPADVCIVDIQHTDNSILRDNELNVFISIENFMVGRTHYKHLNTFGRYGNSHIGLYMYNDTTQVIMDPGKLTMPIMFLRMNYFKRIQSEYKELVMQNEVPFHAKKFCLFTSRNILNSNKAIIMTQMSELGEVDYLSDVGESISKASCWNSIEMLRFFNQYKFIVCFENSNTDGYVTEKIFNVFLSCAVPIYDGSPDITKFISKNSFISFDANGNYLKKVKLLMSNESIYNGIVNHNKFTADLGEISATDLTQYETIFERAYEPYRRIKERHIHKQSTALSTEKRRGSCYFCGCARDCGKYIDSVFKNIHKIGSLFENYRVIIFYDSAPNSKHDTTLHKLIQTKVACENMKPTKILVDIIMNSEPTTSIRTQNIATARNGLLERVREENRALLSKGQDPWEYFAMIDMDDVCSYPVLLDNIEPYLTRVTNWDALSFNRTSYYDTWALSYDPYIYSCWNWPNSRIVIDTMNAEITRRLAALGEDELLPCYSAFNGFAMYKTAAFAGCAYNWQTPTKYITESQMEANCKACKEIGGGEPFKRPNNDDCEHRWFHLEAIHKNDARIRIAPRILCDETEHIEPNEWKL